MLVNLKEEELRKTIEEILQKLIDSGLIKINDEERKHIIDNVTKTLAADDKTFFLTKESLNDPNTRLSIGLACIAEMNPANKFDYTLLFKQKFELEPKLEDNLKNILKPELKKEPLTDKQKQELNKRLAMAALSLKDKLNPEQLEKALLQLKMQMERSYLAETLKNTSNRMNNTFNELTPGTPEYQRYQTRVTDYGYDIKNPGSVVPVLQAIVAGNETSRQDLAAPGSKSLMGQLLDTNTGKPDPLGIKLGNLLNDLLDGVINSKPEEEFEKKLNENLRGMSEMPSAKAAPTTPFRINPFDTELKRK